MAGELRLHQQETKKEQPARWDKNQQGGTKTRKVWHPGSQTQKVFQEIGRNQPYQTLLRGPRS